MPREESKSWGLLQIVRGQGCCFKGHGRVSTPSGGLRTRWGELGVSRRVEQPGPQGRL